MKTKTTDFQLNNSFTKFNDYTTLFCDIKFTRTSKGIAYGNVPCVLDIETSSFFDTENRKCACLYAFTFGINGKSILGRTYDDMLFLFDKLCKHYELNENKRLIFYVHNLSYEFQFIRGWFRWINVFATNDRTPLKATTDTGIEFRCSYLLSGYALYKVGENLLKYKVNKMVGDLDYRKIRHSKTPLTEEEKKYILNDGLVVMAYIQELIEQYGMITRLPLTKTGAVRKYCRDNTLYDKGDHKHNTNIYRDYHRMMLGLSIKSPQEYEQIKRAFTGGFTHANAWYTDKVVNNVSSWDFTSSYPAVMVMEQFPMGRAELIDIKSKDEFYRNLKLYCCIFDITFYNLENTKLFENPLSLSKCRNPINYDVDNGRIVNAEQISTTLTEVDFSILSKFYKWERMTIKNFRRYKKSYLPTGFIKAILHLYKIKTELKDVEGKEIEYKNGKERLNACYGMAVTDICRDEIKFDQDKPECWIKEKCNIVEQLEKYNNKRDRFLSFVWGIYVTAYARYNLFTGILECGMDYVYSDTDSIKTKNGEKHTKYINDYNNTVIKKLKKAIEYHKLTWDYVAPKTIKGVEKILGVWDFEGTYTRFKTLGAKRYMTEKDGKISLTVSGINKYDAIPYLKTLNKDLFDLFTDNLYIPPTYTQNGQILSANGKRTHTYIDEPREGYIIDYRGKKSYYYEKSCIHIIESEYTLSLSKEYLEYLFTIGRNYEK